MTWNRADIPDQSGRVVVVTGANGGLGLETAQALAVAGAHVVMAARNPVKTEAAVSQICAVFPDASLEVIPLDLASQAGVRKASEQILDVHRRIDVLVNNAGVMAVPEGRTEDGFETQLAVNHLGHFALTGLLLPALLAAPAGRVVSVTSTAHHIGRAIDPANPNLDGKYRPFGAYGQSKLANLHFALGLQRRFDAAHVPATSILAHPGLARTELQSESVRASDGGSAQTFWDWVTATTGMSASAGALPQLRAATDPSARGGDFFGPVWVNFGQPVRKPILRRFRLGEAIDKLWRFSEEATGVTFKL